MDPKLYKSLEFVFIAGLLAAVLYLGRIFTLAPGFAPPTPTPRQVTATPEPLAPATLTPRPIPTRADLAEPAPPSRPVLYTIVAGDTCIGIAAQFEVSLQSLIDLNGLDDDCLILAGSTLKIPPPAP